MPDRDQSPLPAVFQELGIDLNLVRDRLAGRENPGFAERMAMRDRLEIHVLDRLEGMMDIRTSLAEGEAVRHAAARLMEILDSRDDTQFLQIREGIRAGNLAGEALRNLLLQEAGPASGTEQANPGYDNLDILLNGIFSGGLAPEESRDLEPEMVFYQKTPGRIILELVERAHFSKEDVFYDLGSGWGQVPMLVHLLSGVRAQGVERDSAYVRYSRETAAALNLASVSFLEADVRSADVSDGTVFFLYTPFTGRMLAEVVEKLRRASRGRRVRVFTYGPCTLEVIGREGIVLQESASFRPSPHRLTGFVFVDGVAT